MGIRFGSLAIDPGFPGDPIPGDRAGDPTWGTIRDRIAAVACETTFFSFLCQSMAHYTLIESSNSIDDEILILLSLKIL